VLAVFIELGVHETIEIVSTGHAARSRREAGHVGRVRAVGEWLSTGVLVGRFTDGRSDCGCIDARYLRTEARRAGWAATRALGCRDDTGRLLADFLTWVERPEVKIHGSQNRIADLHAACIDNLPSRVFHADLVNHTGRLIDCNGLHKRPIRHAVTG